MKKCTYKISVKSNLYFVKTSTSTNVKRHTWLIIIITLSCIWVLLFQGLITSFIIHHTQKLSVFHKMLRKPVKKIIRTCIITRTWSNERTNGRTDERRTDTIITDHNNGKQPRDGDEWILSMLSVRMMHQRGVSMVASTIWAIDCTMMKHDV